MMFAECDVPADSNHTHDITGTIVEWRFYCFKVSLLSILRSGFLFKIEELAVFNYPLIAEKTVGCQVRREYLIVSFPKDLRRLKTNKLFKGLINNYVAALNVFKIYNVGDGIYQCLMMGIQLPQDVI